MRILFYATLCSLVASCMSNSEEPACNSTEKERGLQLQIESLQDSISELNEIMWKAPDCPDQDELIDLKTDWLSHYGSITEPPIRVISGVAIRRRVTISAGMNFSIETFEGEDDKVERTSFITGPIWCLDPYSVESEYIDEYLYIRAKCIISDAIVSLEPSSSPNRNEVLFGPYVIPKNLGNFSAKLETCFRDVIFYFNQPENKDEYNLEKDLKTNEYGL